MMNNKPEFLKDTELANRYGVSRPTIWRWLKEGKIPNPIKIGVGVTRWKVKDLQVWEESGFVKEVV